MELGYHLDDVVDVSPYEEQYVAKQKEKSRAELLAEKVKAGAVKRTPERAPSYTFPANTLRGRRDRLGLKQSLVASECEVDPGVLSAIERGSDPRLSTALRVAAFYGCSVDELFRAAVLKQESVETASQACARADAIALNATESPPLPFDGEPIENGSAVVS